MKLCLQFGWLVSVVDMNPGHRAIKQVICCMKSEGLLMHRTDRQSLGILIRLGHVYGVGMTVLGSQMDRGSGRVLLQVEVAHWKVLG